MEGIVRVVVVVLFGVLISGIRCQEDTDRTSAGVYMVTLKQAPSSFHNSSRAKKTTHPFRFPASTSGGANTLENPR